MSYTVYVTTQGHVAEQVFNAVAAIFYGEGASAFFKPILGLMFFAGIMWATLRTATQGTSKLLTTHILPVTAIIGILITPKASVNIIDVSNEMIPHRVDNVPWALAALMGLSTTASYDLSKKINAIFTTPDDLKYHKTGMLFGSRLIQKARMSKIVNYNTAKNMRSFIDQCVLYEALLERKYDFETLKTSENLWELVRSNASPARAFSWTGRAASGGAGRDIITCQAGAERLNELFAEEARGVIGNLSIKIFGDAEGGDPTPMLRSGLQSSFDHLLGFAQTAEEIIKQEMMIYSVVDAFESSSYELGNGADFSVRKAYLQHKSGLESSAKLAAEHLPTLQLVMQLLLVGAFIIVVPLSLFLNGISFLINWAGMLLQVLTWGPLYSIINMIMMSASRSRTPLTIGTTKEISDDHSLFVATAGGLCMSIPFLSMMIFSKRIRNMGEMAGSLMGGLQGAAQGAGAEIASGNISMGNLSLGNVQAHNMSSNQENWSSSYQSGHMTASDGEVTTTQATSGETITNVASSTLRSKLGMSESLSNSFSDQSQSLEQASQSEQVAAMESKAAGYKELLSYGEHLNNQESSGNSYSHAQKGDVGETAQQLSDLTDQFAKKHDVSNSRAASALLQVTVGGQASAGLNIFGTGGSVYSKGEAVAQGKIDSTWSDLVSSAEDFSEKHNIGEMVSQLDSYAKEGRYGTTQDSGKSFQENAAASFEESRNHSEQATALHQKSESYSTLANQVRQNASSIDHNLSQDYYNWLRTQPGVGGRGQLGEGGARAILTDTGRNQAYSARFIEETRDKYAQSYISQKPDMQSTYGEFKGGVSGDVNADAEKTKINNMAAQLRNVDKKVASEVEDQLSEINENLGKHRQDITTRGEQRKTQAQ
tara:strand:- start:1109 stop:3754 length:2646 start_codon:yes stop_codon:yes gene_type:complete